MTEGKPLFRRAYGWSRERPTFILHKKATEEMREWLVDNAQGEYEVLDDVSRLTIQTGIFSTQFYFEDECDLLRFTIRFKDELRIMMSIWNHIFANSSGYYQYMGK